MTEERPAGGVAPPADPTPAGGLTDVRAARELAEGRGNRDTSAGTRSTADIVRSNLCTLFNAVNVALAALVFTTGSYRNMLFLFVVAANAAIGIFQELRSKRALDRLTILAARPVRVRREGREVEVPADDVVMGDLVLLAHGAQVPCDCLVREGSCLVNESLLTGESRPQAKAPGDTLLSGSFVVSGSVCAQATAVGPDSFAARIGAEAKTAKPVNSQIMATLRFIVRLGTCVLVPVGLALFLRSYLAGGGWSSSVLTTVAAVVGMIPQGLILLTSTVLAVATVRLAERNVLVQQLYCIEALARVDVLCLDKTGTITSGAMTVRELVPVGGTREAALSALAAVMGANAGDANETARAFLSYLEGEGVAAEPAVRAVPFSSERKYSGCVTAGGAYAVGALQFLFPDGAPAGAAPVVAGFPATARVLAVCAVDGFDGDDRPVGAPRLLALAAVADEVRPSAPETLAFFREQGVRLNVISGDDPRTVSAIAAEAGVPDAGSWVDATTLRTPEEVEDAAARYRVFGRVTPQQKRDLVRALQRQGRTVAMTGDGVNDVLALREADCSVAMASGSDAARAVAEIVLVDNDFASMPHVVDEGRRSINNLQRSASLFLVKTVFSMAVGLLCVLFPPYPLLPIQLTLVSVTLTGIPSLVLALEPNRDRVRGSFLANVLSRSVPASAGIVLGLGALVLARGALGFDDAQVSTVATCVVAVLGVALIYAVSRPLNALRRTLLATMAAATVLGITAFGPFFEVAPFSGAMLPFLVLASAAGCALFAVLYKKGGEATDSGRGPYVSFASYLEEREHAHS